MRRYLLLSILSLSIFVFSPIAHASGFTDAIINPFRVVFAPIAAFMHREEMAFGIVTTPRSLTAASTLSTPPPQPVVKATTTPWTFSTIVQTTKATAIAQPTKREKSASPSPHQTSAAITEGVVLGASTSDSVVTQSELQTAIEQANNALRQLIYANVGAVGQGQYSSGGYTNSIALTNRIDQLSGTKLSNITVNSVSGLTAADIPTNIVASNYLPLSEGSNDIDVFLIAGQSNAQGYGNTTSGPVISPGSAFQYYNSAISPANDPVGNANTGSAWPQFAISYYAKTGHKVAFVPAAIGGTALDVNAPSGGSNWSPSGTLYATSVAQTNAAMAAFKAAGYVPHLVGVLWDQGENDADAVNASLITGANYQSDLQTLVSNYRAQLGSNLPFYIFRTGQSVGQSAVGYAAIRNAQEAVAAANTNTFVVFRNAVDFPARGLMNGSYHYSQAGYNEMGRVGAENIANRTSGPYWEQQSSNVVFDTSQGGNVGIGTNAPSYLLDVNGTGHFKSLVDAANFVATSTSATSTFAGGLTVSGASHFQILQNGVVTIGTSTPSTDYSTANLTVNDSSTGTYSVAMSIGNTSSTTWSNLQFSNDASVQAGWIGVPGSNAFPLIANRLMVTGWSSGVTLLGATDLRFDVGGYSSVSYEKMRIISNGNVGIGTTSPATALSVAGNTYTTGGLGVGLLNTTAGTLQTSGNATIGGTLTVGTSTPYARLTVWGSDSASSTLSFNVVNNASTTVFAVFNGGNAQLSGTLTQSSDRRLKTNIDILDASSSLAAINELQPVAYDWLDPEKGGVRQYGFIAQQVQQVFPELVSTTSATALTPDGTLGLNYLGLIAPLVEAVQGLSTRLSSLEAIVVGFTNSFTSKKVTTEELCIADQTGQTCVTKSQIDRLLSGTPSVQISAPTPPVISGTTTPPSIDIQGNNPASVNVGDTYTDLGAIVHDNQDHDLSYRTFINGILSGNILIDTSQAATDTIDYVATDTWGNTATATRTVIIEAATSTAN